jgi:hypothetical protein
MESVSKTYFPTKFACEFNGSWYMRRTKAKKAGTRADYHIQEGHRDGAQSTRAALRTSCIRLERPRADVDDTPS